jgi:sulfur-carrier protein adenylyltransferase/sulfurtransferase
MFAQSSPMTSSIYSLGRPHPGGYRDISPITAAAGLAGLHVVDVREPHEFRGELGHIPGAELVPLATLAECAHSWDRDAELLLVCRSGARSGRAAALLSEAGFRRVMNLTGGMIAYNAAGLLTDRR